jgi:probable phosphoglycerate mutase
LLAPLAARTAEAGALAWDGVPRLLCIRHARSTWNELGRWQGQADPPLSEAGRAEALALAERLAPELRRCKALVTSDLVRARETAVILGGVLTLTPEPWPLLREADIGSWSGRVSAEIEALWPEDYRRFRAGDPELRPGGGENRRALRARALAALRALEQRFGGEPILVVTHLGWLRALAPGLELANAGTLWLDSAALDGAEPAWCPEEVR